MLKRKVSILIIAALLIVQFVNGLGFTKDANASIIGTDILTGVTLTVKDDGVVVTDAVYAQGSDVTLDFTWALPNGHPYDNGDTYTFDLPREFKLFNDVTGNLVKAGGGTVGTFIADQATNKVTMTFTNIINNGVQGTLTLNSKFDTTEITVNTTHVIHFPVSTIADITVHFKPTVAKSIDKEGIPHSYNAHSIDWTIDINKTLETVKNAVITDPIPAGLGTPSNLVIKPIVIALDGTISAGVGVLDPANYTVTNVGGTLKIEFINAAATINTAYRITYETPITSGGPSYTNKATISSNLPSDDDEDTVTIVRGTHLGKSSPAGGYNAATQTIDWEIKFNYDEAFVAQANATLTDLFDNTQHLVPGSIEVIPITLSASGVETEGAAVAGYTTNTTLVVGSTVGFKLDFTHDLTSAYKIKYKTKANDRVESNKTTINNTVSSTTYTPASAGRDINQVIVTKNYSNVNYLDKTVDWEIKINGDKQNMTNVDLTDTFSTGGLEIIPGSLEIKDHNGANVSSAVYTLTGPSAGFNQGFLLHFNSISDSYTISYKTNFNKYELFPNQNKFENTANVKWAEASHPATGVTITKIFDPNNENKNNGLKLGSYDAINKEFTWQVGFNYNSKNVAVPIFADTLLEEQTFIPGSLKVFNMNIAAGGAATIGSPVSSLVYSPHLDAVTNTVYVNFAGSINSPYFVEFKTSMAGKIFDDNHVTNTAHLFDSGSLVSGDLTKTVTVPQGGEYVNKEGSQSGTAINWKVNINRGQSVVDNASILDQPSDNQLLLPDSFHLFNTIVNSNGVVSKNSGSELVKNTDYTLAINTGSDGKQSFVLSFLHTITTAYILEYKSAIFANNNDPVENKVKFTGDHVTVGTDSSTKQITVKLSTGSGTGSGFRGKLIVNKVDSLNNTIVLNGATFELYRDLGSSSKILINTITTGLDGRAEFNNLLEGNYLLKETVAPVGYVLDSTLLPVVVDSTHGTTLNVNVKNVSTATPTPTPGQTGTTTTSSPKQSPTATPTATPVVTPTATPTATPLEGITTPVPEVSPTPTAKPSATPTPVVKPTPTPVGTKEITKQDVPKTGTVEVPDGSTPTIGKDPEHGTVTITPDGKWVYTPKPGFIGKDKFSVIIKDKDGNEEEVFIDIDVEEVPLGVTPDEGTLPTTGESSHLNMELAGLALILLGVGLSRRFAKRREDREFPKS